MTIFSSSVLAFLHLSVLGKKWNWFPNKKTNGEKPVNDREKPKVVDDFMLRNTEIPTLFYTDPAGYISDVLSMNK